MFMRRRQPTPATAEFQERNEVSLIIYTCKLHSELVASTAVSFEFVSGSWTLFGDK